MRGEIHIGKLIHEKMEEERRSANWLANKLGCTRENVYKIYDKSNIDMVRLLQISRALNYDFFSELSGLFCKIKNDTLI